MQVGISTSSLFLKADNDKAMELFREWNVPVAEVFLSTFSEYTREFASLLKQINGKTDVHSIHCLNTNFEPQLYNRHPKVRKDAFFWLEQVLVAGETLKAKYYTFHGVARLKKSPAMTDYEKVGIDTAEIQNRCKAHGISLAFENVHWAHYNAPGFFSKVKEHVPDLKGTLDVKQARQSGYDYTEYLTEMGSDLVTVHLSDVDESGKVCLPGKGIFNFEQLFARLKDVNFKGALLIEVYPESYTDFSQLTASLDYLQNLASKVF
ncbi:MAG: sugar phosphate isomerase/epimerase [Clostridia bacterium]|nr:sugar phosphate isomerase/epimerase [Clostridia bacterium]